MHVFSCVRSHQVVDHQPVVCTSHGTCPPKVQWSSAQASCGSSARSPLRRRPARPRRSRSASTTGPWCARRENRASRCQHRHGLAVCSISSRGSRRPAPRPPGPATAARRGAGTRSTQAAAFPVRAARKNYDALAAHAPQRLFVDLGRRAGHIPCVLRVHPCLLGFHRQSIGSNVR